MKKKVKKVKTTKARTLTSQLKGRSAASIKADKKRKAKAPGKRKSKSGKKYFEDRPNRSDINRKTGI
jgi:hypothetical protein